MELDLNNANMLVELITPASVSVPNTFPLGTLFGVFDGIPISEDLDRNALAWDVPGGRRFPYGSSSPNCALISEAKFRELVNQLQGNGHG
jgi:hypothetical protein